MTFWQRKVRWGKPFFFTSIILIVSISTLSFSFKYYAFDETSVKINELENAISNFHAALKIDSVRQYKIQKILNIINRYNKTMPMEKKYEIADEIYKMCLKYKNLDIDLVCATITHESALSWNPEVVSFAGAMGLMQIMPTTGIYLSKKEGLEWTTSEEILFNPINNIRLGCRYLSSLIDSYEVDGGLAAYNGGEDRAVLWIKNNRNNEFLWEETREYVPAVLRLYKIFRQDNGIL